MSSWAYQPVHLIPEETTSNIKTINGLSFTSIKSWNGILMTALKSWVGLVK